MSHELDRVRAILQSMGIYETSVVDGVRSLADELDRVRGNENWEAIAALDRLTKPVGVDDITLERAEGPSLYEDYTIASFRRERGRLQLRVIVTPRGVCAELVDAIGQVTTLGDPPPHARDALTWLAAVFGGDVKPRKR